MKKMRKQWSFRAMLTQIVVSYLILAALISLSILLISDLMFEKKMNNEIEVFNQRILEKSAQNLQVTIFDVVRRTYLDMVWSDSFADEVAFFSNHTLAGHHDKLLNVHKKLTAIAALNTRVIDSVHIYYPDTGIFVSSSYGYKKLNAESAMEDAAFSWILNTQSGWQSIPEGSSAQAPLLSYVGRYEPLPAKGTPFLAAVFVREAVVRGELLRNMPFDYAVMRIADAQGNTVVSTDRRPVESEQVVVSTQPLQTEDWELISEISLEEFYASTISFRKNVVLCGAVVFIIALGLSLVFAEKIYQPIKRLTVKAIHSLGVPAPRDTDEYALIDASIDHLLGRADHLQYILKINETAIKHHFLLSLLSGSLSDPRERVSRMESLGIHMDKPCFTCAAIHIEGASFPHTPFVMRQTLQYGIADAVSHLSSTRTLFTSCPIGENKIVVIINAMDADSIVFSQIEQCVEPMLRPHEALAFYIAYSPWFGQLSELPTLYKEVQSFSDYRFFYPDTHFLQYTLIRPRQESEAAFDGKLLETFEAQLNSFKQEGIVAALHHIVAALKTGAYSAEISNATVLKVLSIFSNFKRTMDTDDMRRMKGELHEKFYTFEDIDSFEAWLRDYIVVIFSALSERGTQSKNLELSERLKQYIIDHLSGDLSLEAISAYFFVSPKHLCKLFKQETGETFSEFIIAQRMERAKQLLLDEQMSIQQIGEQLGYHSASYFIRKFKEFYGDTPKTYRRKLHDMSDIEYKSDETE